MSNETDNSWVIKHKLSRFFTNGINFFPTALQWQYSNILLSLVQGELWQKESKLPDFSEYCMRGRAKRNNWAVASSDSISVFHDSCYQVLDCTGSWPCLRTYVPALSSYEISRDFTRFYSSRLNFIIEQNWKSPCTEDRIACDASVMWSSVQTEIQ